MKFVAQFGVVLIVKYDIIYIESIKINRTSIAQVATCAGPVYYYVLKLWGIDKTFLNSTFFSTV